jgi:hypothetical protein
MSWQTWLSFAFILASLGGLEVALWRRAFGGARRKAVMRRHRRIVGYPDDGAAEDPRLAVWERALERLENDG